MQSKSTFHSAYNPKSKGESEFSMDPGLKPSDIGLPNSPAMKRPGVKASNIKIKSSLKAPSKPMKKDMSQYANAGGEQGGRISNAYMGESNPRGTTKSIFRK